MRFGSLIIALTLTVLHFSYTVQSKSVEEIINEYSTLLQMELDPVLVQQEEFYLIPRAIEALGTKIVRLTSDKRQGEMTDALEELKTAFKKNKDNYNRALETCKNVAKRDKDEGSRPRVIPAASHPVIKMLKELIDLFQQTVQHSSLSISEKKKEIITAIPEDLQPKMKEALTSLHTAFNSLKRQVEINEILDYTQSPVDTCISTGNPAYQNFVLATCIFQMAFEECMDLADKAITSKDIVQKETGGNDVADLPITQMDTRQGETSQPFALYIGLPSMVFEPNSGTTVMSYPVWPSIVSQPGAGTSSMRPPVWPSIVSQPGAGTSSMRPPASQKRPRTATITSKDLVQKETGGNDVADLPSQKRPRTASLPLMVSQPGAGTSSMRSPESTTQ